MLTSNRSDFRHYTRNASVTISNRRVRTRMHGGVAGVGGQPPPLCRSNGIIGIWPESNSVENLSLRANISGPNAENILRDQASDGGAVVSGVADFSEGFLCFAFFGFSAVVFGRFLIHLIGL